MPIWLLLVAILVTASVATAIFVAPTFLSPKQDFSLQPVGASLPVWAGPCGSCREFKVRVNSLNGFTGIVSFTTAAPANLNVKLAGATNPNPLALLGRNDTLFVDVGASNVGNYTFTVTGTSGVLSHSVTLTVIAQSLTFTVNPNPIPIVNATSPSGGIVTTNATMTLTGVNGFSGNLYLSVVAYAQGFASVYSGPVFLPFGGTASATITASLYRTFSTGTILPCGGPGYLTVLAASSDGGGVSHTFPTVCVP